MSQPRVPSFYVLPDEIPKHIRDVLNSILGKIAVQVNLTAYDVTNIASTQTVGSELVLVNAASGNVRADLPPALEWVDRPLVVKKKDASSNLVLVAGTAGQLLDGVATLTLSVQYSSYQFLSDGEAWWTV